MQQNDRYRHELKYGISYPDYAAMRRRLGAVMKRDPHAGENGSYRVRSIYFDNSDDKALREKAEGFEKREKFRIRYYNDDLSYIVLEKKLKTGRLSQKFDAVISEDECRRILAGDIEWMKDHPEGLVKELYAKMRYQQLRPRLLVSYLREPYIYPAGNVRVTFDSEIRTSLFSKDLLTENVSDISATDGPRDMILEVKYDAFLPEIIQDLIQSDGIRQQAFSKYGTCRRFG